MMKLIKLDNINKKDIPLHYRNEYSGIAIFESKLHDKIQKKLLFSIEKSAVGEMDIKINFTEDMNYPLLPIIKSLKSHISQLHSQGKLP